VEFSQITENLYVGNTPQTGDYEELERVGVGLVINMRFERRPYPNPSFPQIRHLWLRTFDSPLIPIPISALIKGVRAATDIITLGRSVYAHCAAGAHRGVAMGSAILVSQGISAEEAMYIVKERRHNADPYIWYIRRRIEKFEKVWRGRQG